MHLYKINFPLMLFILFFGAACTAIDAETAQPTAVPPTETPTAVPLPTPTLTPAPETLAGATRANPLPVGSTIHQPPREIQVTDMLRGEDALAAIKEKNAFTPPLTEGREYLLLNLRIKNIGTEDVEMSISPVDFDVTGDNLLRYGAEFGLTDLRGGLFPGGEMTGQIVFSIAAGEHNLMLISDPLASDNPPVFLALEDGASISAAPLTVLPTGNGLSRSNPAHLGEEIVTAEWKLTVNRVIRGEKAWQRLLEANAFNDPPPAGKNYLLVNVSVQYLGDNELGEHISSADFKSTGSKNVAYDAPSVVEPEPALDVTLFPGGKYTGWVALLAGENEEAMKLIFSPGFSGEEDRFILLAEQ